MSLLVLLGKRGTIVGEFVRAGHSGSLHMVGVLVVQRRPTLLRR